MPPDIDKSAGTIRNLRVFGGIAVLALASLVVTGIMARESNHTRLAIWTENQAVPTVATTLPSTSSLNSSLTLPGRLEAFSRAPIFARVSGYLKEWKVDIGAPVKGGQTLAEIDAPDLDQQLLQARADLQTIQSAARLSELTLKRRQALASIKITSAQDLDEKSADLTSKLAGVKSSQANVDRLEALASYKKVVAPFDGVVTARDTDVGSLVVAGGASGSPLFVISDTSKLRVYINVPQSYGSMIGVGAKATISVSEQPGRNFQALVDSSSQAVDASSGTIRMQLIVANESGGLFPGGHANVRVEMANAKQSLSLPASALLFDKGGLRVAIVDSDNRVSLRSISIARDLGREIEIASGLNPSERVIIAPPDGLVDGDKVRIVESKQ